MPKMVQSFEISAEEEGAAVNGDEDEEVRQAGFVTWGVAWFFILVCFIVALASYGKVGPKGDLGNGAMTTLQDIAGSGTPRGYRSPSNELGRKKLLAKIDALMAQYPNRIETAHQVIPNPMSRSLLARTTQDTELSSQHVLDNDTVPNNLVFLVKGDGTYTGNGSAILASAHHDSVGDGDEEDPKPDDTNQPTNVGPGVTDDLAGVAVLLEVARTLASSPALPRDVIFALVDGEELGCRGSSQFRRDHIWNKRPAFVLNLEGKGKSSSKEWLVRANSAYAANAYARFATAPAGFSLGEWVFATLSVGFTDLSVYNSMNFQGFDLVFVHDAYVYHTPRDSIDNTSPEGLQHEGSNALAIIRGLAQDADLKPFPSTRDADPNDPMTSQSVYLGMFDSSFWLMSTPGAMAFFGIIASLACGSSAVLAHLFCDKSLGTKNAGVPEKVAMKKDLLRNAGCDFARFLGAFLLGILAALVSACIVGWKDKRVWYAAPMARFMLVSLGAVLPLLTLERFCVVARYTHSGTSPGGDHAFRAFQASLGALWLQAVLLALFAIALPHVGFAVIWQVLFPPVGLAVELAIAGHFVGVKGRVVVGIIRDLFSIFLPLLLTLPQTYNMVYVFSYLLDSLGSTVGVGGVEGIFLGLLPVFLFVPTLRRLSARMMNFVFVGSLASWVVLAVVCMIWPVNHKDFCYFDSFCADGEFSFR